MTESGYGLWPLVALNTVAARLGDAWAAYAARTPGFIPAALRHPFAVMARTGRRAEP